MCPPPGFDRVNTSCLFASPWRRGIWIYIWLDESNNFPTRLLRNIDMDVCIRVGGCTGALKEKPDQEAKARVHLCTLAMP